MRRAARRSNPKAKGKGKAKPDDKTCEVKLPSEEPKNYNMGASAGCSRSSARLAHKASEDAKSKEDKAHDLDDRSKEQGKPHKKKRKKNN